MKINKLVTTCKIERGTLIDENMVSGSLTPYLHISFTQEMLVFIDKNIMFSGPNGLGDSDIYPSLNIEDCKYGRFYTNRTIRKDCPIIIITGEENHG